jgi:cellulose synthase/poly-beta-1,6-N-acetylglucosamine synthase-like glycosyltransferase
MEYVAYLVFGFTAIQLGVALVNLVFRQEWRHHKLTHKPTVSVLIPARNEAHNIGNLLNDLLLQDYEPLEILVFNDQSTDHTANIVSSFSKLHPHIQLLHSQGLPKGWLGKNFACYSLSQHAKGDYFLFLDADVRLSQQAISQAVAIFQQQKVSLLSVFSVQEMKSVGERMTVPVMNFILLTLLPLFLIRKSPFSSLAAANGQFMMFDAPTYNAIIPHEKLKACKVEDIEIARLFKRRQLPVACIMGSRAIRCRMYTTYREAVHGFAKNIKSFFGGSWFVTLLFWLMTSLGFISIVVYLNNVLIIIYLMMILLMRMVVSVISRQNIILNLVYLLPQQWAMGEFIVQAFKNTLQKKELWKGRNIS